jgi:mannose-6-phosphate isomerase-like protein (cupin superfamily)
MTLKVWYNYLHKIELLKSDEHVDIGIEVAQRIANKGSELMVFIEIQQGRYFGEDDYGRSDNDQYISL